MMKAGSSTESEPFRKLSKNDILQTTDQWKEKTIHKLGEISGLWISWAKTNQVPTVPELAPEPPTKPSSESIMRSLKARMRQAKYNEAASRDPKFAEEKKPEDIPDPDDIEVWEEYERLKVRYQKEARDYERQEKMALETFPHENKKVFSRLIDCISEASVQELKRTKEGAKFFEEGDSFNFMQLAIKEHEYLSPDISSAAVARAKDDFESLRQRSEDFITEHVNEFKRKLEVYLKARGPGQASPYADFDLRDLLLRSLYQPTWRAWIESRYVNDNMPATYEELVTALKKAETTKILRTSSPIDPFQSTSHATSALRSSSTPPSSTGPIKCANCGALFYPKKPNHTRCDRCQEEFVKQRKKESKKGKEKDKKKKQKEKAVKEKRAHATTGDEDEKSDGDESEEDSEREATSFSCICSTRATSPAEGLIYLDNCSNLNVIRDQDLALNMRREKVATRISGSIPGALTSHSSAEVGDLGRGCYDPGFSRNLISEDAAIRAGYSISRDSSKDNRYYLKKEGRKPLVFSANGEGTFSISIDDFRRHFSDKYAVANMTDVDRGSIVFTKRQRERAAIYQHDHGHCLSHLHHDKVITALRKGLITNVPYTEADVRNALTIYGPCEECTKTKGTKHRQVGHYPVVPEAPGERLAGDLFMIGGVLFSLITCRLIKLRCVTKLQNKGAGEITRAVRECVNIWKGYGAKPKVLSWDQEPALVHCAAEIWAQHSLRVEHTSPDAHERVAERDVRTIKEHVYATILGLGHAVDAEMIDGIVRDTVTLLNFFPNSETVDGTPRTYLDGERLNYERWSRVYAGQVAEFEIPYAKQLGRGVRKEIGYVIGHQGDNPVVRLLPSGKRLVVRSGHINVIGKSPGILSLIEKGIQGAKRQHFNDLIAEMQEFFTEETENSSRHPKSQVGPRIEEGTHDLPEYTENMKSPEVLSPIAREKPAVAPMQEETVGETPMSDQVETVHHNVPVQDNVDSTLTPPPIVSPPRRSARSGAQKPPGYYARLHSGDSVADYTACHLRATECARLYGEEPTKMAATTEVLNMIRDRGAAKPQDYRKLSARTIQESVSSFMFFKAKDLLPHEAEKERNLVNDLSGDDTNTTSWSVVKSKRERKLESPRKKVKIRGRWVGGGHQQQREESLAERVAPTARGATHNILMTIAAFEGRQLLVGDIPSAYLQADHVSANGKAVHIIADRYTTKLIVESMPEYADLTGGTYKRFGQ